MVFLLNIGNNYASSNQGTKELNIPKISAKKYEHNIKGAKNISYQKLMKMVSKKNSFSLFIGYKECGEYCRASSPVIHNFVMHHKSNSLYYLDVDKLRNKSISKCLKDFLENQVNLEVTPTIVKVYKGKVVQKREIIGYGFTEKDLIKVNNIK
ncbi:hypothetical protein DY138_01510 [Apilactobacillus timberlakei]|uniref:conjugal transfer protein TraF n=1 Tax=Apilactobacillus timberlakei TaxID=2008380 RepID=UPI00112CE6B9|nr:conjugal transfer protein TraF [Apilactobacillus timberlakei]TPR20142.1 hypothetical protein DY138_01510 [Apilactobacillus timberlakei]TPR21860.1 hypothetical protein DY061_01425 [Apilactobacillus timberlakei]TPR22261.1 hypothetical protein DY083_04200 [Apilactobacillus timberlakei]TPR24034.1 hypothetical protein DY102_02910 [Apilactobacillus timberlakei]